MRTLLLSSLFALSVLSACGQPPDEYAYETHIANIRDATNKGNGFSGMKSLVKTVITSPDNAARIDEFVTKVIPVFEEAWDASPEHQVNMLEMLRDIGRPEGANLWIKALGTLDGSEEGRKRVLLALSGIQKSKSKGTVDAVLGLFEGLVKDPSKDKGKAEGEIRMELAKTLGLLKDTKAVPALIAALEQPTEMRPPAIHRAVAEALGQLHDPKAVEPLVIANFSIADEMSTKNLGNRVKLALVSIGEPAIPRLVELVTGKADDIVIKKVVEAGANVSDVRFTAALMLGSLGSPTPVDDLIKLVPASVCTPIVKEDPKKKDKKKKKEDEEEEVDDEKAADEQLRNALVTSLGQIGDPKAVPTICNCSQATVHFEEQFMMVEALGLSGGPEAVTCLANFIKTAESNPDSLPTTDKTSTSIRVEAARFAILAAGPDQVGAIKEAIATNTDPKLVEGFKAWEPGLQILETCKADKDCYLKTVKDTNANWFAREKAAVELSKLAAGDQAVAEALAHAYKVREADARVTMALMISRIMRGKKCQTCVDALEDVMKGEKGSTDISFQKAVLTARDTIAKLSD